MAGVSSCSWANTLTFDDRCDEIMAVSMKAITHVTVAATANCSKFHGVKIMNINTKIPQISGSA